MKGFLTLLRRELWEERGAFIVTPMVIGGVILFLTLLALSGAALFVERVNGEEFMLAKLVEGLGELSPAQLELAWDVNLFGLAGIFNVVLFFVVFFYLLGSLYDDRKDRSILFWKSMPISDMETVLSKLAIATVIAPILMVIAVALTELILMLIASWLIMGADLSVWDYLWGPADPLRIWSLLIASYFVQALWMLPVWGWLLLASAFARSKPFLWAVVPPVLFAILQGWFNLTQYLRWDNNWMWKLIGERLLGGVVPLALVFDNGSSFTERQNILRFEDGELVEGQAPMTFSALFDRLGEADLWGGVIFGVLFIVGAIVIRRYRDDT